MWASACVGTCAPSSGSTAVVKPAPAMPTQTARPCIPEHIVVCINVPALAGPVQDSPISYHGAADTGPRVLLEGGQQLCALRIVQELQGGGDGYGGEGRGAVRRSAPCPLGRPPVSSGPPQCLSGPHLAPPKCSSGWPESCVLVTVVPLPKGWPQNGQNHWAPSLSPWCLAGGLAYTPTLSSGSRTGGRDLLTLAGEALPAVRRSVLAQCVPERGAEEASP